ncbi:MAG TPA: hypothetical protein VF773_16600 [Verrucomicrobiae bacterium]
MHRIFLLSPANSSGERAQLIFNPKARFDLARRMQRGEKAPLGEIFSFLSGLYFRGKYVYSTTFARPPARSEGAYVITSSRGFMPVEQPVSLSELADFGTVPIEADEPRYIAPLQADASKIVKRIGKNCEVVLLGSIGTKKYAEPLMDFFGDSLLFPSSFVGRGDMSRGGLLLRCVAENRELEYVPLSGAIRHGKRPEKLAARSWGYKIHEGRTPLPK